MVAVSKEIAAQAAQDFLAPAGQLWDGADTLILLAPAEPGFWTHFSASPEYNDHRPDPLDRWSKRVIGGLATQFGGTALFPSDGPPYPAFISWARNGGRAWVSPVGMLVHDTAGLMLSLRGALCLPGRPPLAPMHRTSPCDSCAQRPCRTACPVNALTADGYDVAACKRFLHTEAGKICANGGCIARRACPVSQTYGRLEEQSAFHMRAFISG